MAMATRLIDVGNIDIEAIKDQHPLASVVEPYVSLKKKAGKFEGLCPFHAERTPSFKIFEKDDRFHCFGCGAHGDVFDFLYMQEGLDLRAAAERLTGGTYPVYSVERIEEIRRKRLLLEQEDQAKRDAAIVEARERWLAASHDVVSHPYLDRKQVGAHGIRLEGELLLIPLLGDDGKIQTLQSISPGGRKLFVSDAPVTGGLMVIGGKVATADNTVLLCEGYATAASLHEATGLIVVCAFNSNNLPHVAYRLQQRYPTKRYLIAGDDDRGKDKNVGMNAAIKAAEILQCSAVFPFFPEEAPGSDFNDMACMYGPEAVRALLIDGQLPSGDPAEIIDDSAAPEPVDLWARYQEPPLPKGLLPEVIERFATIQGEIMGADAAGLAMSALTVCAAAIPDAIGIQVKRNDPTWVEHARLWMGLVGPPSRKKTPIMKAALAPLRKIDNTLMRAYLSAKDDYDALTAAEKKEAERPRQKRLIISDTTVEAAQEVLRDSPDGVLSEQDELSGWFGGMDKYAPGKGAQADRAFWLKAFNGGTYNLNRIGRGASQIPNLSVSLLGGIQPEPIRKLATETMDDGLIQRLIPVILRPASVGRDIPSDNIVQEYDQLVGRLHLLKPPQRALSNGRSTPLMFSSGARTVREKLEQEHLELVEALETVSPKLAAHFGKYDGIFARLCLLWHCIEHTEGMMPPPEVSQDTAQRVADFMADFIRPAAIAFYAGLLGMSAGHEELLALASYIVSKKLPEVKPRDAQGSTKSLRSLTAEQIRSLCERLEAFGWLVRQEPGPKSSTWRWMVNPRVHSVFANQAALENERRERARQILEETLRG